MELALGFIGGVVFGVVMDAVGERNQRKRADSLQAANEKLMGLILAERWADGLPGAQTVGVSNLTKDWGKRFDWTKMEEESKPPEQERQPGGIEIEMGV